MSSTLQFAHPPDFVQTVTPPLWLETAGLNEPWLELELTETLLIQNMRDAAEKLAQASRRCT